MKTNIKALLQEIKPFKDIVWFLFLFIALDFLWKLFINTDEDNGDLLLLGKNITSYVEPISVWTAKVTYWIINDILGHQDFVINGTLLYFDHPITYQDFFSETSLKLRIVWECTGVKQMILFSLIILFYYGPPKKKLGYIAFSMVVLNLINVLRIVASALLIKDGFPDWFIVFNEWYNKTSWLNTTESYWAFYTDWFQLFHKDIFKWLYYNGVIFILWLIWQEKYNLPYQKLKKKTKHI